MSYESEFSVEYLLHTYKIDATQLQRIQALAPNVVDQMSEHIEEFYVWLRLLPEYEEFLHDDKTVRHVREAQVRYWERFMEGRVDEEYVEARRRVGRVHARIGLPMHAYFAGMNYWTGLLTEQAVAHAKPEDVAATISACTRLINLDAAIVTQMYAQVTQEALTAQSTAVLEMSTPVTQVWEGVLMLPLVGIIDSARARDIMRRLLEEIGKTRAQVAILDISGVAVVDTAVANHLIKITRATSLMGCECTISGVSSAIAETIVELGIDVGSVRTTGTLMDALSTAFRKLGVQFDAR